MGNLMMKLLCEDNGNPSTMRAMAWMANICIAVDWMNAVFTVGTWNPAMETIMFVLTVNGLKVFQKFVENKSKKGE